MLRFITINTTVEFICMLTAIWCLRNEKEPAWLLFFFFLPVTVLVELGGICLRMYHRPNFMLYNVFLVVECLVQNYFFFYLYGANSRTRKWLISWLVLFAVFYGAELMLTHFSTYLTYTSTLMSVELILASVYYYFVLIKEEQSRRLGTYGHFWWVNGTICFYFAGIASNLFFNYLVQDHHYKIEGSARYIVFSVLNIILYFSWSYAFVCRYRQRNSTSSSSPRQPFS